MRKICLVEDDQAIREVLEIFLSLENYEVESFSTVSAYTKRNSTSLPDLYLFDVKLPDGSGINLCRQIKDNKQHLNTPVILLSANANPQEVKDLCRPDDFVSKPFDINNLLLRIRSFIK